MPELAAATKLLTPVIRIQQAGQAYSGPSANDG